jgi:hypothetical protein
MTFFVAKKHETIMLSFFHHKSLNKFCYFLFSFAQESKKFWRNGQESMSKNGYPVTFLGKNARH